MPVYCTYRTYGAINKISIVFLPILHPHGVPLPPLLVLSPTTKFRSFFATKETEVFHGGKRGIGHSRCCRRCWLSPATYRNGHALQKKVSTEEWQLPCRMAGILSAFLKRQYFVGGLYKQPIAALKLVGLRRTDIVHQFIAPGGFHHFCDTQSGDV